MPVLVLNVVATLLTYLLFYLALHAIGVTHVSLLAAVFVLALSYVLAGFSFIPGGLGAFEGLLTVLMATNGVPVASGAAAGLLYRAYNDGLMAALGAGVGIWVRRGESRRAAARSKQRSGAKQSSKRRPTRAA